MTNTTGTKLTAVEEIQAAIEKLTASKPDLTACPEFQYSAVRHISRNCDFEHECRNEGKYCGWQYETAAAFDMLTRTIDAQLALLGDSVVTPTLYKGETRLRDDIGGHALDLARAINGASE
jgi:hypothetical protein